MLIGFLRSRGEKQSQQTGKAKRPWFILGFLIAAAIVTWIPETQALGHDIETVAKKVMVLTLFLIGSSLTRATIKSVGFKPFLQGICLWLVMGISSLSAIYFEFIH
jgi:uncharacterized membrane protein YadS